MLLTSEETIDLQKLFIASLTIGTLLILICQYWGSRFFTVALPMIVMVVYVALGFYRQSAMIILDQFADSIYYMGFLFTLVALIASLYSFNIQAQDIDRLVGNFSLALITTVVGLAIRLIISNFAVDDVGARRRIAQELEQTTNNLIRSTQSITIRLENLDLEIHTTIQKCTDKFTETFEKITVELEEKLQETTKILTNAVHSSSGSLIQATTDFHSKVKGIEIPKDIFIQMLGEPIQQFVRKLEETENVLNELVQQQQSMRDSSQRIAVSLDSTTQRIDSLDASLVKLNQEFEAEHKSKLVILDVAKQMAELSENTKKISIEINNQTEKAGNVTNSLVTVMGQTEKYARDMDKIIKTLEGSAEAFKKSENIMQEYTGNSKKAATNIGLLSDAISSTERNMTIFSQAIATQQEALIRAGASIQQEMEIIKKHRDELQELHKETQEALRAVTHHFAESARYVTEKLTSN